MKTKNCSVCGISFTCGAIAENKKCWCTGLPNIMPLDFSQDCRCPGCLEKIITEMINERNAKK